MLTMCIYIIFSYSLEDKIILSFHVRVLNYRRKDLFCKSVKTFLNIDNEKIVRMFT